MSKRGDSDVVARAVSLLFLCSLDSLFDAATSLYHDCSPSASADTLEIRRHFRHPGLSHWTHVEVKPDMAKREKEKRVWSLFLFLSSESEERAKRKKMKKIKSSNFGKKKKKTHSFSFSFLSRSRASSFAPREAPLRSPTGSRDRERCRRARRHG